MLQVYILFTVNFGIVGILKGMALHRIKCDDVDCRPMTVGEYRNMLFDANKAKQTKARKDAIWQMSGMNVRAIELATPAINYLKGPVGISDYQRMAQSETDIEMESVCNVWGIQE